MTVWETVRATELTAVFSPQIKNKTVGSNHAKATNNVQPPFLFCTPSSYHEDE